MPRQQRKPRERRGKQPHEVNCTRLTRVRVLHVTDDGQHFRFTHAGVEFWGPAYAFQGHPVDLRTTVLYLAPGTEHHVQPVGGRQHISTPSANRG